MSWHWFKKPEEPPTWGMTDEDWDVLHSFSAGEHPPADRAREVSRKVPFNIWLGATIDHRNAIANRRKDLEAYRAGLRERARLARSERRCK